MGRRSGDCFLGPGVLLLALPYGLLLPLTTYLLLTTHLSRRVVLLLALPRFLLELLVERGRLGDLGLAHLVCR